MSFHQSCCVSFEKFINSWSVGEWIFLWLLLLDASREQWWLIGSVIVCVCLFCMCVGGQKGTCLLHFITSVPPTQIASLNPFICANSFASIWGRLFETVTCRWGNCGGGGTVTTDLWMNEENLMFYWSSLSINLSIEQPATRRDIIPLPISHWVSQPASTVGSQDAITTSQPVSQPYSQSVLFIHPWWCIQTSNCVPNPRLHVSESKSMVENWMNLIK